MQPGIAVLRGFGIFSELSEALLRQIDAMSEATSVNAGVQIIEQGDMPHALHLVREGQVTLSTTAPDNTRAVVEVVRPDGSFVLASALANLPYVQSAHAVQYVRLIAIDAQGLRDLAAREPTLAMSLLESLSRDYRNMVRQIRDLKVRTTAQRLGAYLLALVPDPAAHEAEFRLPFEKGLLAGRLGCRQENLSRAFATLRELGVETRGARVWLSDIPRLTAYAAPDYLNDSELAKTNGDDVVAATVPESA